MKKLLISFLLIVSNLSFALTINSQKVEIAPSAIDRVIRLVDKADESFYYKKLSIIVKDLGLSTDVSPRYAVYLGYMGKSEMINIQADFLVTDKAMSFIGAERLEAGKYEVKFSEYRSEVGMVEVKRVIDATQLFIDEKKVIKACTDFCDEFLNTSIEVSEKVSPIN